MSAYYTPIQHNSPEVISIEQAKKQLKMEDLGDFDNDLIQDCIDAAIDEAENYCNIAIRQVKYRVQIKTWTNDFKFMFQKVTAIDQIKYIDVSGNEQILSDTLYQLLMLDKYEAVLHFTNQNNLPLLQADNDTVITIDVTVGYDVDQVPKAITQAIKLLLTDNYEYRGDREKPLNTASRVKLEPYKFYKIPD